MKKKSSTLGFSLVELLVAIAIFSIVALMGTTAILVTIASNKTSQAVSQILSNFSLALEAMSRNLRVGAYYHCGDYGSDNTTSGGLTFPLPEDQTTSQDCDTSTPGADNISFLSEDNETWFSYFLSADNTIHKAADGHDQGSITAPEIIIDTARFFVRGSNDESLAPPDRKQPQVTIVISGRVENGTKAAIPFNIQTTVSQRLIR